MSSLLPLEAAWEQLLDRITPLASEAAHIDRAAGRTLVRDVIAQRTQPSHDLSAMDGFAVRGGGPWNLIGESRAGHPFEGSLEAGEAVHISTGAHMPQGSESVLIVENARVDGALVHADTPPLGKHTRRAGFDFAHGDVVIAKGTTLNAARIALARSSGNAEVEVGKRPLVAVIECGDELAVDPLNCRANQLPASNGAMLAAMARGCGAEVVQIGPVADTQAALAQAFADAAHADLVVTSGGASVGPHDLVKPVLEQLGAKIGFWKVAIKPGKPMLVAQREKQLILGLPGNPVSSFVTGFLFALPTIRALQGCGTLLPSPLLLPSATDLGPGGARQEFLRATIVDGCAHSLAETDSSALLALSQAELLIDRPIDAPAVKAGETVACYCLPNALGA
ncbi:molybdopterin molybdotransferase MoeA [Qipengyuania sp. DGS5-3]|uniref:molybdopterin molybdotransferase MoeA n=1 Tax=Qipengyuania sp. DGS5-3 TaxID=3349632 RepID=UPI0036D3A2D8